MGNHSWPAVFPVYKLYVYQPYSALFRFESNSITKFFALLPRKMYRVNGLPFAVKIIFTKEYVGRSSRACVCICEEPMIFYNKPYSIYPMLFWKGRFRVHANNLCVADASVKILQVINSSEFQCKT